MNARAFERIDEAARHVLDVARYDAASNAEDAVGTEDLLVALSIGDAVTAGLLAEVGAHPVTLRRVIAKSRPGRARRPSHETLLATLGVELSQIRRQAEATFGHDAVALAASRARPREPRRPLRSWFSCSKPLPRRTRESPLVGRSPEPIPRVRGIVRRAARSARPHLASPSHLLLALLTGNEPACEILTALDIDLDALTAKTRRWIAEGGTAHQKAS